MQLRALFLIATRGLSDVPARDRIVVNAQLLYPGGSISHIVAAVIGGATLT